MRRRQLSPSLTSRRGLSFSKTDEQRERQQSYSRPCASTRKDPLASYNYGLVLLLKNELDEAITQFQIVLPSGPDDLDARFCLGRAFLAEDWPVEAAACLQKAISLRPDDAHAHNVLGVALAKIREFSRAVGEFETAGRLQPPQRNIRQESSLC